jgi:asparagine synthase (glutamine-hydrolysing)
MCGLTGVAWGKGASPFPEDSLRKMNDTMMHRGPDSSGIWIGESVSLAHRRLSIVDLSSAGNQPMLSSSMDSVIIFNGEIYNHEEFWKSLNSGHSRRGHSDTETLIESLEIMGPKWVLEKCVGMFAWAWWDNRDKSLWLARDRSGEKPLYYGMIGDRFYFASELKAIKTLPDFKPEIDRGALALYLRHNYIPGPYTIYKGINKLPPGSYLQIRIREALEIGAPIQYWDPRNLALSSRHAIKDDEAVERLDLLLRQSVSGQLMSDVPVGAFLSGGIDSSAVVSVMQSLSSRPIRTFTIGFNEKQYNEANYASMVARHLGTEHTELYVTPQQARSVIPRLPHIYDEPFSDSSQIPTMLVSELARKYVKVSLSGDGGDELFGGYTRYMLGKKIYDRMKKIPKWARQLGGRALQSISPPVWDSISYPISPLLPKAIRFRSVGDKLHKFASLLDWNSSEDIYRHLTTHWSGAIVIGGTEHATALTNESNNIVSDFCERMMLLDQLTYLPDDILVKVDRAAMAVSLETRVPFLDHRIIEFSWTLPLDKKIRFGRGKWILRQVLNKYLPESFFERPKMGFGIPLAEWLRGPLRDWADSLLSESRLIRDGFFCPEPIRVKWLEHLSGRRNWQYHLWDILMFQAWLDAQNPKPY